MIFCGSESKSKRVALKKKYKIIRKVKEHHKKKAKEAKKLGFNQKRKVEKDPGIPNDWPFKEQELKALEERRARVLEELEEKKAARKERVIDFMNCFSCYPEVWMMYMVLNRARSLENCRTDQFYWCWFFQCMIAFI